MLTVCLPARALLRRYRVRVTSVFDGVALTPVVLAATDREYNLYGLDSLTEYSVTVAAANTDPVTGEPAGYGPDSDALSFFTGNTSAPSVQPALVQTGSTGGSVTVAWQAPEDSGGVALQSYTVYINGVAKLVVPTSSGQMQGTVYGLTNNVGGFSARVAAVNVAGLTGPQSPATTVTTSAPTPATPPTDLDISVTGGGLYASWAKPVDMGGMVLSSYRVYVRAVGGATYEIKYQGLTKSATVGGLLPSTQYEVYVPSDLGLRCLPMTLGGLTLASPLLGCVAWFVLAGMWWHAHPSVMARRQRWSHSPPSTRRPLAHPQ